MRRVTRSAKSKKTSDKPIALTTVDLEIRRYGGKTALLEVTPERLQMSKRALILDLSQRIHELTRENG
jgi:hypothetical protein